MDLNNAVKMNLKCSKFMTTSKRCNDNTMFLVFETTYRTHTLYLILNFIYKKYKHLIFKENFLKKIEDYIKMFDDDTDVNSCAFSSQLIKRCNELENLFYNVGNIKPCSNIDEYLNIHPVSNIIILNKESYFKNEYACYINE
jgi:hypothetical protein